MTKVRAKNIIISVGESAPITSITVPIVKNMKAKIKNHPFTFNSLF